MKKATITLLVIISSLFGLAIFTPTPVSARCQGFLGFPAWYNGLTDSNCEMTQDAFRGKEPATIVWTIVLNVMDIALRIVGILAVGFIIYGGYRYLTSAGDPAKASAAKDTIFKAVIGMVIAIAAASLVAFIVGRLNA